MLGHGGIQESIFRRGLCVYSSKYAIKESSHSAIYINTNDNHLLPQCVVFDVDEY